MIRRLPASVFGKCLKAGAAFVSARFCFQGGINPR